MPQEKENGTKEINAPLSGIETIRDILMGAEIASFSKTLDQIRSEMEKSGGKTQKDLEKTEDRLKSHLDKLEKSMADKLNEVSKRLDAQVKDLHKRIDEVSSNDKQKMAKLLALMSQNLIDD